MPKSITAGLTQDHVLRALAELDAGCDHPFGPPTGYELVHGGKRYAPKVVVGLGFRHATGRLLPPDEFSGGEAPGQANFVLRRLGFAVVRKGEPVEAEEPKVHPPDWSDDEVRLVVADYFAMLEKELLGRALNKTEHRRALVPQLAGRLGPAVEFTRTHISAVLAGQGLPYIDGYKPRGNDQALLAQEVESFLDGRPGFLDQLAAAAALNPDTAPDVIPDVEAVIEDPPEAMVLPESSGRPWLSRRGRRIDFVERDARNRALGRLGEGFVVALERERLRAAGRDDLAGRVEHVANL